MTRTGGADLPKLLHWTRTGVVEGSWGPYETFESLVFSDEMQAAIQKLALGFLGAQDFCRKARLPWRRGAFVFGPAGCGKSAATRAVALQLGWQHLTIAAHEIADSNNLMRALFAAVAHAPGVVVLENLDMLLRRVEPDVFVDLLDYANERADGVFWMATTRRAEEVPKNSLLRPGRFEESLRFTPPSAETKRKYYETHLEPFMVAALGGQAELLTAMKQEHLTLLEQNEQLTYSHLQEMRLLIAKVIMDGNPDRLVSEFQSFCQEQLIAGDRWGGPSVALTELGERIKQIDPRLLVSALHVTDAFKKIVETTISNATEALMEAKAEAES